MEEIKRVLLTRRRVLVFLALVLYFLFDAFQPLLGDGAFAARDGWAPYLENYAGVEPEEIRKDLNTITKNGTDFAALDTYGHMLRNQVEYIVGYPGFLENIQRQAGTMLGVSIFRSDDETVLKTAADYERMEGVPLSIGMDQAVTHAMWEDTTDWLLAAWMLVVAFSFMAERKRGLWNTVCASPGGRVKLPLSRFACLVLAAVTGAAVFTGIEAVRGWILYGGFGELDRYVQSIEMFKGFTIPMTVGRFWLFYAALRAVGGFLTGLVFWLFFEAIPDKRLAAIGFALFAGLEYLLFSILPGDYVLDTLNLFMFISPRNLLTSYEVLSPFGLALGRIEAYLVFAAVVVLGGTAAVLLLSRFRRPVNGIGWVTRLTDFLRRHTAALGFHGRLFFHEIYKMLVTGRGAVVILAALLIAVSVSESPYLGEDSYISLPLETCYRQCQGAVTQESFDYIETQRQRLAEDREEYASLLERYEEGWISDIEFRAMALQYQDLDQREQALDQFRQELETLSTVEKGYVVPHWVYAELFGIQSGTVGTLQIISFAAVSLMCVLYASTESATGMTKARRATARGRSQALAARYGAGIAFSALLSLLIWGAQLWMLRLGYGELPFLAAPARNLIYFRDMASDISIIGYWLAQTAGRTGLLCAWSAALLWGTDRLQK